MKHLTPSDRDSIRQAASAGDPIITMDAADVLALLATADKLDAASRIIDRARQTASDSQCDLAASLSGVLFGATANRIVANWQERNRGIEVTA